MSSKAKRRPIGISLIDINKSYRKLRAPSYQPVHEHDSDSDIDDDDANRVSDTSTYTPMLTPPQMRNLRMETTMGTKIKRIETGTSANQQQKKKRMKTNKSIHDWCLWYWQSPKAHFPILYYLAMFLCCFILSIYWFMDNDSSFIICGIIGLSMCAYATYKFRLSINLKKEVDKYKALNLQMHTEQIKLEAHVERLMNASNTLKECRRRLTKANNRNRVNLQKFVDVEDNMRLLGKKANLELTNINNLTHEIRFAWRDELLANERNMLHTVYERFDRTYTNKSCLGLTKNDFEEFQAMLPGRYAKRWRRMGTFHAFASGSDSHQGQMIDEQDFVNTLDTFAIMETDNRDIAFPAGLMTPGVSCFIADDSSPATPSLDIPTRDIYASTPLEESVSIVITPPDQKSYAFIPSSPPKKQIRFSIK